MTPSKVMSSFLAATWLTIGISLIPALHELLWCIQQRKNPLLIFEIRSANHSYSSNSLVLCARKLLDVLCDLQVITGTAILSAGLTQLRSMTFYHQEFVLSYWWLTLNSFWAARADYTLEDSKMDSVRLWIRRFMLCTSCIISMVFQVLLRLRESREWDPELLLYFP